MCFGQEGIDLITFGVETQRVSAALCLNRFDWVQGVGVKDVNDPRIPNRDVQMLYYNTRLKKITSGGPLSSSCFITYPNRPPK